MQKTGIYDSRSEEWIKRGFQIGEKVVYTPRILPAGFAAPEIGELQQINHWNDQAHVYFKGATVEHRKILLQDLTRESDYLTINRNNEKKSFWEKLFCR